MKDWADADTVNMGDFRVVVGTGRLAVRGLGSCVAVVLYDPTTFSSDRTDSVARSAR